MSASSKRVWATHMRWAMGVSVVLQHPGHQVLGPLPRQQYEPNQ